MYAVESQLFIYRIPAAADRQLQSDPGIRIKYSEFREGQDAGQALFAENNVV